MLCFACELAGAMIIVARQVEFCGRSQTIKRRHCRRPHKSVHRLIGRRARACLRAASRRSGPIGVRLARRLLEGGKEVARELDSVGARVAVAAADAHPYLARSFPVYSIGPFSFERCHLSRAWRWQASRRAVAAPDAAQSASVSPYYLSAAAAAAPIHPSIHPGRSRRSLACQRRPRSAGRAPISPRAQIADQ